MSVDGVELPSALWRILVEQELVPGSAPSYEAAKTIYAYHPLGRKMVEAPLEMAQSQKREIAIPGAPEDDLIEAFEREWSRIGKVGGDKTIFRIAVLSRIYGVGSLFCGTIDEDKNTPLDFNTLYKQDLYFNMLDPLNTAGSLVLNQDPTAPDFLRPTHVTAAGFPLHPSRCCVLMNEQPIWIEWTDSAFGFIGRSVYQRAFYPLKSFLLSMVADNEIQKKLMLLVAKLKSPGSTIDQRARGFFRWKRDRIKDGSTGNVLSIGVEESIESLNLEHVHQAGDYSRHNIMRNIATAAGMPAVILLNETLTEGFGEGTEDSKAIAQFVNYIREELMPAYEFMDGIVMRRAWNPEFYAAIQRKYPSVYANVDYQTAFYRWKDAFEAKWPSFLEETESEKDEAKSRVIERSAKVAEAIVAVAESTSLDPENKAELIRWLGDKATGDEQSDEAPLLMDPDSLARYEPPLMPGPESYEQG